MQKEKIKKNECPTCGHQNDIYTQFCVECGTILEKPDLTSNQYKICPNCSYENKAFFRRCFQCGKSLAGIQSRSDLLITDSSQKMFNSDISTDVTFAEKIPDQPTTNRSGLDTYVSSTSTSYSNKLWENTPILRDSSHLASGKKTKLRRNWLVRIISVIVALLVIAALLLTLLPRFLGAGTGTASTLGEFKASNGELLGVNDGSFPPFLLGNDVQLKQQAAAQLKQGHTSQAISLWQAALKMTNNDAEAWIYIENQRVILSGLPYVTLVAGTDLLEPSGSGLSDLQGVYVAQHEFNTGNHSFRIRILIANSGTDINNVTPVAQQIVNIVNKDKTVVGVISWLSSAENITALPILAAAHIPMISPTASSDQLSGISPFFFRIVPPNHTQGKAAALFAEHTLHARNAVVFLDNHDPYSQNLAQDFEKQFRQDGNTIQEEPFTTDHMTNIGSLIQDALTTNPDLLYFTSRDASDTATFQDALPTSGPFAHVAALSGDAGYVIHKAGYGRWYFASFAFANTVDNLIGTTPPFYQDYSDDFNSDNLKPAGYYGYTRPDDINMLSYDVTSVFLNALQQTIMNNKIAITSAGLQLVTPALLANTLPHVTLQGVTGLITFDADHNPVNKAIVFLAASPQGYTYVKSWQGCFTKDLCRNAN